MKRKLLHRWIDSILMGSLVLQVFALFVVVFLVTFVGAILVIITWRLSFGEALWWAFLRFTDFSTLYYEDFSLGRILGSLSALSGWVVFGLLISIITTAIQKRLDELQKGKLGFDYSGHTIIFGWNQTIYSVLDEFSTIKRDASVVIMNNRSAEQMYNDIRSFCRSETFDRVVCRMGNPESIADQNRINVAEAREVIVLNSGLNKNSVVSDAAALKTLLALFKNLSDRDREVGLTRKKRYPGKTNVIVELSKSDSLELIRGLLSSLDISDLTRINFFPILTTEVIGKLLAHCAFQPGLSLIYQDIFSYRELEGIESNTEIYILPLSSIGLRRDTTFEELVFALPAAIAIGYVREDGVPVLNPPQGSEEALSLLSDRRDAVICIAENEEAIMYSTTAAKVVERNSTPIKALKEPEENRALKIMVLGVGVKAMVVVDDFIKNAPAGSTITCARNYEENHLAEFGGADLRVKLDYWNMIEVNVLLANLCTSKMIEYDIVVFAEDIEDAVDHDALSLMLLAGINSACVGSCKRPRIVMDLFDHNNVQLAKTANADDVIIGAEVTSNYLFQIAVSPLRYTIFSEILSGPGLGLAIKPAAFYCDEKVKVSFSEIMEAARRRSEVAIGYTYIDQGLEKIVLNPAAGERTAPTVNCTRVVVLSRLDGEQEVSRKR